MLYLYLWIAAQIIIEMLPISSSGHLTMLELLLKKYAHTDVKKYFNTEATLKAFYYFLHGPTLLIVCGFFFAHWWQLVFSPQGIGWHLIVCLLLADLITFLVYLLFQKINATIPLGLGFLITAGALFSTYWCMGSKSIELLSFSDAAILGVVQGLALLPGVSRLAITCSMGCWLGFSVTNAFFLSWTMQVPLMAAACAKSLKDLHQTGSLAQVLNLRIGFVMLISSGASAVIMGLLIRMTQNNTWYLFGWYMLVPLVGWLFLCSFPSTRPKGLHRDER